MGGDVDVNNGGTGGGRRARAPCEQRDWVLEAGVPMGVMRERGMPVVACMMNAESGRPVRGRGDAGVCWAVGWRP